MQTKQTTSMVSLPFPSTWGIHADIAGRPMVWGTFSIQTITNNMVYGTVNFRGRPIPIQGSWNEGTKQITLNSPYASYSGNLSMYDEPQIGLRHFILSGRLMMKPPSLHAGEFGTWIATTNISLSQFNGQPLLNTTNQLPPVGVFLTSNILKQQQQRNYFGYLG